MERHSAYLMLTRPVGKLSSFALSTGLASIVTFMTTLVRSTLTSIGRE